MDEDTVADHMIRNVISIPTDMKVKEVTKKITDSNFSGFPVTDRGFLSGFITSKELLRHADRPDATMNDIIKRGTICVMPSMKIGAATRVLFRYGIRNLPVVDNHKRLVGIISNIDIVRSQIEKIRPAKIISIKSFLESQNDIKIKTTNMDIPISQILPSQKEVYIDELVGRQYEIRKNILEPLIVVKRHKGYLVIDGHHRAMAAMKLGIEKFRAIVLEPDDLDVRLGLEKTAEKWGVRTLNDISVIERPNNPLLHATTDPLSNEKVSSISKRLKASE